MSDTISARTQAATACAVFKIDLRGRFVYIDDETEELLGCTREELFGKSIYEFISSDSHQAVDTVLGRHNRYESFYEAASLLLRIDDGQYRRLDAVITLNFISGNPVNYQFILMPLKTTDVSIGANREKRLLECMQGGEENFDCNRLAEIFCVTGGYAAGECYRRDSRGELQMVGSHPHHDPGHSAPAYLDEVISVGDLCFSGQVYDRPLPEGFGAGRSEATVSLRHIGGENLVIRLYGPPDYSPPQIRMDDLSLYTRTWNRYFQSAGETGSLSSEFSLLGTAGDAVQIGIVVVDAEYSIIYCNSQCQKLLQVGGLPAGETDFKAIYDRVDMRTIQSQPLPFEQSPFARAVTGGELMVDHVKMRPHDYSLSVFAAPFKVGDTGLYLFFFSPAHTGAAETSSQGRYGQKIIESITHDVRAPLITIDAFVKRLKNTSAHGLPADTQFAISCIAENCLLLREMIDGLHKMSQNWAAVDRPEKLNVKKILDEIIVSLRATYPHAPIDFKLPGGCPDIHMPKRHMVQIFRNILDNAIKYSIASGRPTIKITYDKVDGWHQFSIQDSGPGIGSEYKDKIFTPFFRTPQAMSSPGTGMGLAIVSDIISSWGGKVWLDTTTSSGTTISFLLPPHIGG